MIFIVKIFIILNIVYNLCISLTPVNVIRFKESSQSRITGTHHIYSLWFDCRNTKYIMISTYNVHKSLVDVLKKTLKQDLRGNCFLKSLINLHVIIIITRNKDISLYKYKFCLSQISVMENGDIEDAAVVHILCSFFAFRCQAFS